MIIIDDVTTMMYVDTFVMDSKVGKLIKIINSGKLSNSIKSLSVKSKQKKKIQLYKCLKLT